MHLRVEGAIVWLVAQSRQRQRLAAGRLAGWRCSAQNGFGHGWVVAGEVVDELLM